MLGHGEAIAPSPTLHMQGLRFLPGIGNGEPEGFELDGSSVSVGDVRPRSRYFFDFVSMSEPRQGTCAPVCATLR